MERVGSQMFGLYLHKKSHGGEGRLVSVLACYPKPCICSRRRCGPMGVDEYYGW